MKKAQLLLLFILCYLWGIAQNIGKTEFERLVDYANCKYTETYIESIRNDKGILNNIDLYDKKYKNKLDGCSISNPLGYNELSNLLKESNLGSIESNLFQNINGNKELFDSVYSKNKLIEKILSTEGLQKSYADKLDEAKNKLNIELSAYFDEKENNLRKKSNHANSEENQNIASEVNKQSSLFDWIIGGILGILLISILGLVWYRTDRKRIENIVLTSHTLKEHLIKKSNSANSTKFENKSDYDFKNRIDEIENKVHSIYREIQNIQLQQKNFTEQSIVTQQKQTEQSTENLSKYLKTAPNGFFNNVFDNPNGCYFKLFEINGNHAKFEFCGNTNEAIANRNAIFDETSEPFDPPAEATRIITKEAGTVIWQDGKWKITTRAKIKFE